MTFERDHFGDLPTTEIASIPVLRLEELFERSLPRLDANRDGYVDFDEASSIFRSTKDVEEKVLCRILLGNMSKLEELSNDEWGDENSGVTLADMEELSRIGRQRAEGMSLPDWQSQLLDHLERDLPGPPQLAARFGHDFHMEFGLFDRDKNGQLTRQEIQSTIDAPMSSTRTKRLGEQIMDVFDKIVELRQHSFWRTSGTIGQQYHLSNYLTPEDAKALRYHTNPSYRFDSELPPLRTRSYAYGAITGMGSGLSAILSIKLGAAAVADPEPVSKCVLGAGATFFGSTAVGLGAASLHLFSTPARAKRDYLEMQRLINNWFVK